MKLLLINPKFPESFWSFSWALNKIVRDKRTSNSPLGLATVAALTPQDWDITIIDENVEPQGNRQIAESPSGSARLREDHLFLWNRHHRRFYRWF